MWDLEDDGCSVSAVVVGGVYDISKTLANQYKSSKDSVQQPLPQNVVVLVVRITWGKLPNRYNLALIVF